jgi:hypothetical protein
MGFHDFVPEKTLVLPLSFNILSRNGFALKKRRSGLYHSGSDSPAYFMRVVA